MKPQFYKNAALAGLILLVSLIPAYGQARPEEKLFQEAKILLFDEKWEEALEKLETVLKTDSSSSLASQALFYKAKCLSRLDGREPEAVASFKAFLQDKDRNPNLAEEAEVTVIDLSYKLYARGNRSYLREVESRLRSSNKVGRYYAAFKLSYAKDRTVAAKSLPVLKNILAEERDMELKDRARIALMRVDPQSLKEVGPERSRLSSLPRKLRLEISEDGKEKLKIAIPWALADLAIQAIPEKEKQLLIKKGYDLERIMKDLERTRSSIIEITGDEGRTFIKMWIE